MVTEPKGSPGSNYKRQIPLASTLLGVMYTDLMVGTLYKIQTEENKRNLISCSW